MVGVVVLGNTGQGFILTRQQKESPAGSLLELWLASEQGCVRLQTAPQQSVFFVTQDDSARVASLLSEQNIPFRQQFLDLTTFSHQPVSGFYFSKLAHLYRARDELKHQNITCYEDDIRLADRFLMERFVYGSAGYLQTTQANGQPSLKLAPSEYHPVLTTLSLDIECSMQGELYSIGLASGSRHQVLMIGAPEPDTPQWITWCQNEKQLLQQLNQSVAEFDPDVILGWNVVNFDFRLLLKRAERYGLKLRLGRDGSPVFWRDAPGEVNQGFISMAGRVVVDGIDALKTATYQFESFSLEFVAQALLGKGKDTEDVDNRVDTITHDFRHNKVKLAKYNLQDCVLVLEIFEQTRLMDFLVLRSRLTGLELDRVGGSVAAFTNVYLPKLHRAGYVSPNRPRDGGLASPGGYVMNSRPGLYQQVLVLDFKSLYPSIIRTFKIDPLGLVEGLKAPEQAIPGFRGGSFSREMHFLPDIIAGLWQQRDVAKAEKDSARSQAIKILMNSFYGVLGSGGCRFYDTRLASSITMRGHEIMQTTARLIEEKGYQVIYGDTDSTFVWLDCDGSHEQAEQIGRQLAEEINQYWQKTLRDDFQLDCHLEIEFETLFSQFLMPTIRGSEAGSKKRYAGLKWQQGEQELVFKGLESVRSDWTALAREFQQQLYAQVFAGEEVTESVRQLVQDTRAGLHDEQLVYRKRLRRPLAHYQKNVPPHVRAARFADEINQQQGKPLVYQNKGWISYVITLNGPEPIEYVRSAIDYEHYIERQIQPVAEGILPFIGINFESLISEQMGLF